MAIFIFVHGGDLTTEAWNVYTKRNDYPAGGYMGGKVWDSIAAELKAQGHSVFTPSLKDKNTCTLSDHIEQICALIKKNHLNGIILVGHSYGGMVITGVANQMVDNIGLLVYLDAALPDPSQSLFDLLRLGGFDPEKIEKGSPLPYIEKLQFDPKRIRALAKVYIFCTESSFISVASLAKQKITADPEGWTFLELRASHVPQATMPHTVAKLLLKFEKTLN